MTDPTAAAGNAESSTQADEQAIRERVRDLTAQMLSSGRLDTEGVKEVVRVMSGGASRPPLDSAQAREALAASVGALGQALQGSAAITHEALQALVTRGKDFSDNDLKNAFAALQKLQRDYVAVATLLADASVRVAEVMSEFANRIGGSARTVSAPGFDAMRQYGANMTMLTSGMLAGFADALRQQSERNKAK